MKRRNFIQNTGTAAIGGILVPNIVPSIVLGENPPGKLQEGTMKKFCPTRVTVTLDEPVVVAQAPPDLDRARAGWGRWQFPHISRLADGQLLVRFSIESDSRESRGKPAAHAYSSDNGRTWRLGEPQVGHEVEDGVLLPNGDGSPEGFCGIEENATVHIPGELRAVTNEKADSSKVGSRSIPRRST